MKLIGKIFVGVTCLLFIIGFIMCIGLFSDSVEDEQNNFDSTAKSETKEAKKEVNKTEKPAKPTKKPEPKIYKLSPGNYTVNKTGDLKPGTYNIYWVSGSGNVISHENGDFFDFINLLMSDGKNGFVPEYKNAILNDGAKLQIENVTIELKEVVK